MLFEKMNTYFIGGILLAVFIFGGGVLSDDSKPNESDSQKVISEPDDNGDELVMESKESSNEVKMQGARKLITHGSTVALQVLAYKSLYLSCRGSICNRRGCPHLYMEGGDWSRCYGEVFQIYRRAGSGYVRVGEDIALYYPRESGRWLGCAGSRCVKATCPGSHTCSYGFSSRGRWHGCWGEVFKIYVRGKRNGAAIRAHDQIMLYLPRRRTWIGIPHGYAGHYSCPGRRLPPPAQKYDHCWGEVFELLGQ